MSSYGWPSTFLAEARETVAPPRGGKDGLLPPLLVALTAVTGLVDAFSYLVLGHVFVANMTVLTLTITGIAADGPLAGRTGAKAARRLISIAAMLAGAVVGAVFVLHVRIVYPLVVALVILAAVALTGFTRSRSPGIAGSAA
ncbi:MAG TPA: DUF1275 family protein [Streptosporangiaceae bacterium]